MNFLLKYVFSVKNMKGVYDKSTGISDDEKNVMATFNFFNPNLYPSEHKKADVDPYLKWGN